MSCLALNVTLLNSPVSACSNLKKRGWLGQIEIDDMAGKLIIRVKAEGAKTAHQDLKTLSGGERSFITICFLLALGKQLQASFHCLDEFDVFMDSVSQGVSCRPCIAQQAFMQPLRSVVPAALCHRIKGCGPGLSGWAGLSCGACHPPFLYSMCGYFVCGTFCMAELTSPPVCRSGA